MEGKFFIWVLDYLDEWDRISHEIGERYLRVARNFRQANMTTESDRHHNGGWAFLELPSLVCLPDLV